MGTTALVYGAGGVGQILIQLLRAGGVRVVALDCTSEKLQLAREMGASLALSAQDQHREGAIRDFSGADGVQYAFNCVGSSQSMKDCARYVTRCGRIVVIGEEPEFPSVDTIEIAAARTRNHRFTEWYAPGLGGGIGTLGNGGSSLMSQLDFRFRRLTPPLNACGGGPWAACGGRERHLRRHSIPRGEINMEKLMITMTCDSTMSYPRNPYNPQGVDALADEYVRGVNSGASICHLHGPTPWTRRSRPTAPSYLISTCRAGSVCEPDRARVESRHPIRHRQRQVSRNGWS